MPPLPRPPLTRELRRLIYLAATGISGPPPMQAQTYPDLRTGTKAARLQALNSYLAQPRTDADDNSLWLTIWQLDLAPALRNVSFEQLAQLHHAPARVLKPHKKDTFGRVFASIRSIRTAWGADYWTVLSDNNLYIEPSPALNFASRLATLSRQTPLTDFIRVAKDIVTPDKLYTGVHPSSTPCDGQRWMQGADLTHITKSLHPASGPSGKRPLRPSAEKTSQPKRQKNKATDAARIDAALGVRAVSPEVARRYSGTALSDRSSTRDSTASPRDETPPLEDSTLLSDTSDIDPPHDLSEQDADFDVPQGDTGETTEMMARQSAVPNARRGGKTPTPARTTQPKDFIAAVRDASAHAEAVMKTKKTELDDLFHKVQEAANGLRKFLGTRDADTSMSTDPPTPSATSPALRDPSFQALEADIASKRAGLEADAKFVADELALQKQRRDLNPLMYDRMHPPGEDASLGQVEKEVANDLAKLDSLAKTWRDARLVWETADAEYRQHEDDLYRATRGFRKKRQPSNGEDSGDDDG